MYCCLGDCWIELFSPSQLLMDEWAHLLGDWAYGLLPAGTPPDIVFELAPAGQLPPLPAEPPLFVDPKGIVNVYPLADSQLLLHFLDGAMVQLTIEGQVQQRISGWLTPQLLRHQRFEDVTFTALAPLLRRRGYYLLHAFAATRSGRAVLMVGPSGSGKTTSGLSLVTAGWQLLANDAVLLEHRPDGIYALPTPGHLHIRPKTLELLPQLLHGPQFVWGEAVQINLICLPQVTGRDNTTFIAQNQAITLARLMEESLDSWDKATILAHLNLLQTLSQQANSYSLLLGKDIADLPALIHPVFI